MEIYQLKVFLEVAHHLSFTEAADALNLTQPAVSAKIKSLESSLGADLFYRLGRKVKLTQVGEYLLESGPDLISLESRLVKEINEIKQGKYSRLNIGCTIGVANGWLPQQLFEFRCKYPDIEVQCLTFNTVQALHRALTDGQIALGISENSLQAFDEIQATAVGSLQYVLVVAADHRLAECQWLSLKDLTSEAWVLPASNTPERLALESRLSELGLKTSAFKHQVVVDVPSLMLPYLKQGHYLGFASSLQLQAERKTKQLVTIPLQEFALASKIFLLLPKRLSQAAYRSQQKRSSTTHTNSPVQKFIQLLDQRISVDQLPLETYGRIGAFSFKSVTPIANYPTDSRANSSTHSVPRIHLQSPNLVVRNPGRHQEALKLKIGTQHKTIQTVTAGLVIQRLGLLEHFLPRTGAYSHTQYQIQWRDYTSGAPIVAALQSNQLDIGILGDYPLLLSGIPQTDLASPLSRTRLISFVASNPDGAGNTIIVPNRSSISNLADLRHRSIAVPFESAAHGMIMRTLARENLLHEVTLNSIENLSIHRLTQASHRADGYAYFAPLHAIASHQGRYRRLDENDFDKLPTFHGIVVRERFAEQHPDIVVAYLKALLAAQHWYISTPSALSLVSEWVRLNPEIIAKTLGDQHSETEGLFFPETQIRNDWVAEHIRQLTAIPGNEDLNNIDLSNWIQSDFLKQALSAI